jgi:hypothetical protein
MNRTLRIGLFCCALCLLLLQASPRAVGTVTITTTTISDIRTVRYSLAWVSDGSGNVNTNAFTPGVGQLTQIKFIPDGGGTAPTALYDVVLNDANGIDYLGGTGANLSATVSTQTRVAAPLLYDGVSTLDLVVTNAGVSKGGTVQLWFQQTRQ